MWTNTFLSPTLTLPVVVSLLSSLPFQLALQQQLEIKTGIKGSPCLRHFDGINFVVGLPLTNIEIVEDCKFSFIQFIHLLQNLILFII